MLTTSVSLLARLRRQPHDPGWARFVELYAPFLLAWARRLGASPHDAEDLAQDVLTTIVAKMPDFAYEPGRSFRGWLRTVALNRWRDHLRRRRAGGAADLADVPGDDGLGAYWEAEYAGHLARRALELMRAEFRETTWRACWEHVAEGRTAAEVAGRLGMSENAVYIATSRVLRRLREELGGLLD